MTWYYRLDKKEAINTITDVPKEQWAKKQILPYVRVATADKTKVGVNILKTKVNEYYYQVPPKVLTLDEEKSLKINEIKQTYKEISNEGFTCSNGIKLDCRESDKINWLNLKLSLQSTNVIRDFDNNIQTLTDVELTTMLGELEAYYFKITSTKWQYEKIVKDYTTVDEVKSFYWRKANYDENTMEFVDYTYWVI